MELGVFDEVGELVRSLAPPELGEVKWRAHRRGVKVWFDTEKAGREHFEAQQRALESADAQHHMVETEDPDGRHGRPQDDDADCVGAQASAKEGQSLRGIRTIPSASLDPLHLGPGCTGLGERAGGQRPSYERDIALDGSFWDSQSHQRIWHKGDVWPGQSGGPFFAWRTGESWPRVVSVSGRAATVRTIILANCLPANWCTLLERRHIAPRIFRLHPS